MAEQEFIPAGRAPLALTTEVDRDSLAEIASRITTAVARAEDSARSACAYALEAGSLLLRAKEKVGHGDWLPWLTKHITLAPRTCRAYMQLASKVSVLPAEERQRVADLPVREAVRAITASPIVPPPNHRVSITAKSDQDRIYRKLMGAGLLLRKISRAVHMSCVSRNDIGRARKLLNEALQTLNELER